MYQLGGGGDPAVDIGEQVDVLGGTGADAVGDEGLAAGEGEAVSAGHGERDTGDLVLERVRRRWHQAATSRERSTGWLSSQARRTPRGTYSSGHSRTRVGPCSHARNSSG